MPGIYNLGTLLRDFWGRPKNFETGNPFISVKKTGEYGVVIARPIYSDEDEFGGVILFFLKLHDLIEGLSATANSNTQSRIRDQNSNTIYYYLTFLVIFYMLQLR